ncbi:MAG: hypothetical protein M3520_14595 [Actinomycetota bacterium]|nr:hypothetical protein [Actinomycetota bacterium]
MSDFGVIDEIFNPAADRARQEWDEEKSHTRPAPTPQDPDQDGVDIHLDDGGAVPDAHHCESYRGGMTLLGTIR